MRRAPLACVVLACFSCRGQSSRSQPGGAAAARDRGRSPDREPNSELPDRELDSEEYDVLSALLTQRRRNPEEIQPHQAAQTKGSFSVGLTDAAFT